MDIDELLDGIVASIFLIIVSLIGIYFPYIVTRIFGTHNPYLILEVAGFITYSTSEPGNIYAAFFVTNAPVFLYEFRIIPPFKLPISSLNNVNNQNIKDLFAAAIFLPLYGNKDFLVSIGICYIQNLWQQLAEDVLFSFMTEVSSYLPGLEEAEGAEDALDTLNSIYKYSRSFAKQTAINFFGTYGLYTFQSALLQYSYGNHNIVGDIFNALQSSVGPALWSTVQFTIMQVGDMILGEILPPPFDFIGGFAFNLAFSASITLFQYFQDTSDPNIRCYYNKFIQKNILGFIPNGEYTIYQPYLTLSIYYNPEFTFYDGCNDKYLCNPKYQYIYSPQLSIPNNIFKLELGNVNNEGQQVFPEFIVLSKVGKESGGPYLNVSIISSTS
ncbi:hypothetical protein DDW05_01415 [Candidatus Nanobsidianus stetteri]|uniref:Uncharacterized protein n=1 Tax=Nanobsidianus stetteri TaxID=1294122 RepID=A0A2T9WTW6_NANST|nr:hypothetical protein DDW05_01415 [Candidatus Nanobsidianus stetteri]